MLPFVVGCGTLPGRTMPLKKPVILFRSPDHRYDAEKAVAAKYFDVYTQRSEIPAGSLVVGRYSVLPFYRELEKDLAWNGSVLLNSHAQHRYIADLQNWYTDLGEELTPKTWTQLENVPEDEGPYIIKGETNSRKDKWNKLMFAANKRAAVDIAIELSSDGLLLNQSLYVRKFVPLKTFFNSPINGQPITEEYRFFCVDKKVVCGAYYWSDFADDLKQQGVVLDPGVVPDAFLQKVLSKVGDNARFLVVDVAITAEGKPIVVELNDGQMSGPSENDLDKLYSGLYSHLVTTTRA